MALQNVGRIKEVAKGYREWKNVLFGKLQPATESTAKQM